MLSSQESWADLVLLKVVPGWGSFALSSDLSEAYLQAAMEERSRQLRPINIPGVLSRFNSLPLGVKQDYQQVTIEPVPKSMWYVNQFYECSRNAFKNGPNYQPCSAEGRKLEVRRIPKHG